MINLVYSQKTSFKFDGEPESYIIGTLRLILGWTWLWPFLDKLFGLGFSTPPENSWLSGASPTFGFLKFGTNSESPFNFIFVELLNHTAILDYLFMGMLGFVGIALITGVAVRLASVSGIIFMISVYLSSIPLVHNPLTDEHIIYAFILLMFIFTNAGKYGLSLGKKYQELAVIKKYPILK